MLALNLSWQRITFRKRRFSTPIFGMSTPIFGISTSTFNIASSTKTPPYSYWSIHQNCIHNTQQYRCTGMCLTCLTKLCHTYLKEMLITVRVFRRTAQTAMARQSIFCWQLLGEFRTPTLVKSLSASRTFWRAKMRRSGQGLRELPQLPARQVRMEEEEGVTQ